MALSLVRSRDIRRRSRNSGRDSVIRKSSSSGMGYHGDFMTEERRPFIPWHVDESVQFRFLVNPLHVSDVDNVHRFFFPMLLGKLFQ